MRRVTLPEFASNSSHSDRQHGSSAEPPDELFQPGHLKTEDHLPEFLPESFDLFRIVRSSSLLRMPISPLRLKEGLWESNTLRMNESTARPLSDFRPRNSQFWCNWVKNGVKIFSLAHLRADGRPRSNCSGLGEHNTFRSREYSPRFLVAVACPMESDLDSGGNACAA